jgi:hypothetical protein
MSVVECDFFVFLTNFFFKFSIRLMKISENKSNRIMEAAMANIVVSDKDTMRHIDPTILSKPSGGVCASPRRDKVFNDRDDPLFLRDELNANGKNDAKQFKVADVLNSAIMNISMMKPRTSITKITKKNLGILSDQESTSVSINDGNGSLTIKETSHSPKNDDQETKSEISVVGESQLVISSSSVLAVPLAGIELLIESAKKDIHRAVNNLRLLENLRKEVALAKRKISDSEINDISSESGYNSENNERSITKKLKKTLLTNGPSKGKGQIQLDPLQVTHGKHTVDGSIADHRVRGEDKIKLEKKALDRSITQEKNQDVLASLANSANSSALSAKSFKNDDKDVLSNTKSI